MTLPVALQVDGRVVMVGIAVLDGVAKDLVAIDLKEEAKRSQRESDYGRALPLMLQSVVLREGTRTICSSLNELAELYLEMLQLDKAESTCRRMLKEAQSYDEVIHVRVANECLDNISKALTRGPAQAGSYPFISPIRLNSEFPRAARGNGSPIQLISEFPRAAQGNGSPIQLISEFPRAARGKGCSRPSGRDLA